MWVKAAPGLKVRDPRTRALIPDEGTEVDDGDLNFAKLLEWGDVVQADPPAPAVAPAPEAAPPSAPARAAKAAPAADPVAEPAPAEQKA